MLVWICPPKEAMIPLVLDSEPRKALQSPWNLLLDSSEYNKKLGGANFDIIGSIKPNMMQLYD
jgi:hypothetical protein